MSAGVIISVVLILLLLAAGIVFLVLFLRERNKKTTSTPDTSIQGQKFNLVNSTTIEATWDSVGDSNDDVTLYASTKTINVDSNGQALGSEVLSSGPVKGNTVKSLKISSLKPNTRYYVALVVFNQNPNIINDVVFTNVVLDGEFAIHQTDDSGGYIGLEEQDQTTVKLFLDTVHKTSIKDIWEYDAGQFGDTATFTLFSKSVSDTPEVVLYNDGGKLVAKNLDDPSLTQADITANAQWVFQTEGVKDKANTTSQWCLKNSDKRVCLSVTGTPTETVPVDISVVENSTTQWKNKPIT